MLGRTIQASLLAFAIAASGPAAALDAKAKKPAAAKTAPQSAAKEAAPEANAKAAAKGNIAKGVKTAAAGPAKPLLVATSGDWSAYVTQGGKERTCYALSQPKERQPGALKRDPAYVFISTRPAENVKNEISVIMGFPLKDGGDAAAEIGDNSFELIAKGASAWIKNAAEERQFVDSLRKGSRLVVKAPSIKGNVTTDIYSLAGLSQALERVAKECQ